MGQENLTCSLLNYIMSVIIKEMCLVNHSHCLVFHHNHLIGIFSGYPYEMTRNTAKVYECGNRARLQSEWFQVKPSDENALDINKVCFIF